MNTVECWCGEVAEYSVAKSDGSKSVYICSNGHTTVIYDEAYDYVSDVEERVMDEW